VLERERVCVRETNPEPLEQERLKYISTQSVEGVCSFCSFFWITLEPSVE